MRVSPVKPLWVLLILWAMLVLASIPTRSYIPIDETRYITVAWTMWLSGDYLVPLLNGEPFPHKPPLLFWLINLGWAIFGVNETWPRVLPALFSLACAFLLRRLGQLLWPQRREIAESAPLILMASLLWAIFTTATMFDIMLSCFVLIGLCGLVMAGRNPDGARRGFVLLALALGGGMLAKGPVVLIHLLLPAVAAPWWAPAWAGRWRAWYLRLLLAFFVGTAIVLAWAIPAASAGGETFARAIFWGESANRMIDAFTHKRPFYWYLPFLPLIFYPWLWLPQVWQGLAALRRQRDDMGLRFLVAWLLPLFLFFSLISGKQLHYLLPLFPGVALLFALSLAGSLGAPPRRRALALLPVVPVFFLVAALLMGWRVPGLSTAAHVPAWVPYLLLLITGFFGVAAFRRWRPTTYLAASGVLVVAVFSSALLPTAMKSLDVRPIARHLAKLEAEGRPLAFVGEYPGIFDFLGRLQRPLTVIEHRNQIRAWCAAHPDGRLVVKVKRKEVPAQAEFAQDYFAERLAVIPPEAHRACQTAPASAP